MGCQLRESVLFIGTPSVTLALSALLLVTSAEVTEQVPINTNCYTYLSCSSTPTVIHISLVVVQRLLNKYQ